MYGYELLREAIIRRAILDYILALKKRDKYYMAQIERFFLSEWGQFLSLDNGKYLIYRCKQLTEYSE